MSSWRLSSSRCTSVPAPRVKPSPLTSSVASRRARSPTPSQAPATWPARSRTVTSREAGTTSAAPSRRIRSTTSAPSSSSASGQVSAMWVRAIWSCPGWAEPSSSSKVKLPEPPGTTTISSSRGLSPAASVRFPARGITEPARASTPIRSRGRDRLSMRPRPPVVAS